MTLLVVERKKELLVDLVPHGQARGRKGIDKNELTKYQ